MPCRSSRLLGWVQDAHPALSQPRLVLRCGSLLHPHQHGLSLGEVLKHPRVVLAVPPGAAGWCPVRISAGPGLGASGKPAGVSRRSGTGRTRAAAGSGGAGRAPRPARPRSRLGRSRRCGQPPPHAGGPPATPRALTDQPRAAGLGTVCERSSPKAGANGAGRTQPLESSLLLK